MFNTINIQNALNNIMDYKAEVTDVIQLYYKYLLLNTIYSSSFAVLWRNDNPTITPATRRAVINTDHIMINIGCLRSYSFSLVINIPQNCLIISSFQSVTRLVQKIFHAITYFL